MATDAHSTPMIWCWARDLTACSMFDASREGWRWTRGSPMRSGGLKKNLEFGTAPCNFQEI
jgi:hypothetical protein